MTNRKTPIRILVMIRRGILPSLMLLIISVCSWAEVVSVSSTGVLGQGGSKLHSVFTNGHCIAYYSAASNLVPDDTNGQAHIFVRDTLAEATTRREFMTMARSNPAKNLP